MAAETNLARALQKASGYTFSDEKLCRQALTHRSHASERAPTAGDNQRLEFLGDAIVGAIVADALIRANPLEPEGVLARIKGAIVSAPSLASLAVAHQLGQLILLGRGEDESQGRSKQNVLADAFEALIGAIYLDGGFGAAREAFHAMAAGHVSFDAKSHTTTDSKSALQELTQQRWKSRPTYVPVAQSGPHHAPVFEVAVVVQGEEVARGSGTSRKVAESDAARNAIVALTSGRLAPK